MSDFFKGIEPVPFKGPDSDDPLAFRFYDKDRDRARQADGEQLRMAVAYWHSFAWPGGDPFGGQTFERPWFGERHVRRRAQGRGRLRDVHDPRRRFFTFHDRDVAPEGRSLAEIEPQPPPDRRHLRPEDGGDRRQAALGHRQPVLEPPLHGRRRHQPRPRRLRLRRRAGEDDDRRHPRAGRRQLRALGRPRGLRDPAQHRHEARSSTTPGASCRWSSTTSTRSASPAPS